MRGSRGIMPGPWPALSMSSPMARTILQPRICRIHNRVYIGFDGRHCDSPNICVDKGLGRVEALFAPFCDRLGQFVHFGRQVALESEQPALLFGPVGNGLLQIDEQLRQTYLGAIVRIEIGVAASNQIAALASLRALDFAAKITRGPHDKKGVLNFLMHRPLRGDVAKKLVECDSGEKGKRQRSDKNGGENIGAGS